MNGSDLRFAAA